jgi:hypothetical protein
MGQTTPPDGTGMDPLTQRLQALAPHAVAALAPLLELLKELLGDAERQYDETAKRVLLRTRTLLVERLEEAVSRNRWINVEGAAERLRKPEGTIRYWCRTGKVKARKVGPRAWEIDVQSLYRYDEAT